MPADFQQIFTTLHVHKDAKAIAVAANAIAAYSARCWRKLQLKH